MINPKAVVSSDASKSKAFGVPKSPPTTTQRFILSGRKLLKKLEPQSSAKINPFVDSMRSSSPTHQLSHNPNSSWMVQHPSALEMFDQIAIASKGKQIVMFLDYDGTLSPIVQDPDLAFMSSEMRAALKEVAKRFPTAIVTGRCLDKVCSFVKLSELYYAGSHGMDIKGPTKGSTHNKGKQSVLFQAAGEFLPMISDVYKALVEKTKSVPGASVENNKFCVSVHFRRVEEKRWEELGEQVREVLDGYPMLKLTQGRKVLEIRPTVKWDKGKALEFLLETLGFANADDVFPIYIGDDKTDEDAFKVLCARNKGLGILVSEVPKEDTHASYTLREPSEVKSFLQQLVEWKCLSSSLPGSCSRF